MGSLYGIGLVEKSWCPLLACCLDASSCEELAEGLLLAIKDGSVPPAKSRPSTVTPQLHVEAKAMGDGAKPGQMCLSGAKIIPDPC